MPIQETCFLPHFLLIQPGISRATSLCPSAMGKKDGEWLWWGGGDRVSTCCAGPVLFSFVLGRRHIRNTALEDNSQYLAHHRPWLGAGCSGWRARGQAGNGGCSQTQQEPGPDPAQGGDQAGPLRNPSQHILSPNSLGKSNSQGKRVKQKEAMVTQDKLRNT